MTKLSELFAQAVRCHQGGNLARAESLYREILRIDPGHINALHLLGILANAAGRHDVGIPLIRQAIALNRSVPDFHANLGLALFEQGQLPEAADCFRQTLHLNPRHRDALTNLGNVLVTHGQLAKAAECFQQVLRLHPNDANAHYNLANVLFKQDELALAADYYRQTLHLDPNHAEAHNNMGNVLFRQGQLAQAAECYRQTLRINRNHADAHSNLGTTLVRQGLLNEAVACIRQAIWIEPDNAKAHFNLGLALVDQKQFDEAAACFRQVVVINSDHVEAHFQLGVLYFRDKRMVEAIESFRQTLRVNPDHSDAHFNLGVIYFGSRRLVEAEKCFQQVLRIDPANNLALWNRSCLRLLQGDFEGGWPDYETRWALGEKVPPIFEHPTWDGRPLEGKTILVWDEQGLGDTLQFARYLSKIKGQCGRVVFKCQTALVKVLTGMSGVDQFVGDGETLPPFDVHIPLLSLPGLFGTTMDTIPTDVPYLAIERGTRPKPARYHASRKIGIVWQGSMNKKDDPRSCTLANFESLARVEGVQLVSLQAGPGTKQLADVSFPITDLGSRFNPDSLEDLAAALSNVDLLVSVDTAAAHLAGALGVPVWTLLSFASDWRWLLDRTDSPWYPTMRLFRQRRAGDWNDVFERVTAEVRARLQGDLRVQND